jgi:hypothetical protein
LIYPKESIYRLSPPVLFQPGGLLVPMQGVLNMLLDDQQVVEIVSEHHLEGRIAEYPLLVLPEWDYLEDGFHQKLLEYVNQGGNLLIIGPGSAALFEQELGIRFTGDLEPEATWWLEHAGKLAGLSRNPYRPVEMVSAQPFGRLYRNNDLVGETRTAASIYRLGKGKIAAVYVNLGERYFHGMNYVARQFLADLVHQLFPSPLIEVNGSHSVDVSLGRQGDTLMVNLVNTSGPHANHEVYTFDEIPPVGPLSVSLRLETEPRYVTLQPAGTDLPFVYRDGKLQVILPRLEIYDLLEIV